MIFELRDYTLNIGAVPEYMDNFERVALPIASKYMDLVGFWHTDIGEAHHVIHLWRWDSLDERARLRGLLYQDADWQESYLPLALPMIQRQVSTILNKATFSPL